MDDTIEIKYFLEDPESEESLRECKKVAFMFCRMGALSLRDPRVNEMENNNFLDLLEKYFDQPSDTKLKDARPHLSYQVGVTPEGIETPRCTFDPSCKDRIEKMDPENKAHYPSGSDVKWRYFHPVGPRLADTKFPWNKETVYPEGFIDWKEKMDNWGNKLLAVGETLAEMAAIGIGLPRNSFVDLMKCAPHLLAPTGSDLNKYGTKDQILAGYHQDMNFISLHGKSRFSGLYVWLRDGKKTSVAIPDGCLLAQAGMQFEYLTGGAVTAGFHEVVVNDRTLEGIEKAKSENRPLWRISTTVFLHIASDNTLRPLFDLDYESQDKYPPILAGDQVLNELKVIKMRN